ncbi:HTH_Tnp_Tc3_2 domain-containing protein [Trichonephila clavipes]|nr:HTH_Tnp_Tc3_2 domain-containing protein [Trichonephila clavipes]
MTVRDITTAVVGDKSSASRILRTFQDSRSASPKRKVKMHRRKRKTTPITNKILVRNRKINLRKTIADFCRDLLDYEVEMSTLTVRKRLLEPKDGELGPIHVATEDAPCRGDDAHRSSKLS